MTESKGLKDRNEPKEPGKAPRKGFLDRWRPYAVGTIAMVVVFGGAALVGAHVRGTKEATVKEPTGAVGTHKLALPVHPVVPVTLTVYEDLRSPRSKAFAQQYADTFTQLLDSGQVQVEYRLVTRTDHTLGGHGARAAANAAACAQDQGRFTNFVDALWQEQPDPQDDGLSSEALLKKVAKRAGGISAAKFDPCVEEHDHDGWVAKSQADFEAAGYSEVPVVRINDETVPGAGTDLTPGKLRDLVEKAVKAAIAAGPPPSPSPTG